MPVKGLLSADGTSDAPEGLGRCSFDFALQLAESGDSDAFPYPYPLMRLIIDKLKEERGDYISVTSILHCLRGEYFKRTEPYYVTVEGVYPMLRGTLFHREMEQRKNPNSEVEKRYKRTHRGIEIGGTLDTQLVLPPREDGKKYVIQDWKTVNVLPKYGGAYPNHIEQVNIYRWLTEIHPDMVILEVWYFGPEGIKVHRFKDAYVTRTGKWVPSQVWTDKEVEKVLDNKLVKLRVSLASRVPMPYDLVPDDIKSWECNYCPVKHICDEVADREREAAWRKRGGLPPLDPSVPGNLAPEWEGLSNALLERVENATAFSYRAEKPVVVETKTTKEKA